MRKPAGSSSYYGRGEIGYDFDWGTARFVTPKLPKGDPRDFPPRIIGQLVVISTYSHTASAKVIYALTEMEVGTMVEPR